MPIRDNDPRSLEDWIVSMEQRVRALEARRIDAADGLQQDYATKQMGVRVSDDPGNAAAIGSDGGVYAANTDTITSAADHTPLNIHKYMTANQSIPNATDTLVSFGGTDVQGTWTHTATTITLPEDGYYHISFTWQWANTATATLRAIKVTINSTAPGTSSKFSDSRLSLINRENAQGVSEYGLFNAGDVVRAYVFHEHGVALNGGGPYFSDIRGRLSVVKVHDSFPPELIQSTE